MERYSFIHGSSVGQSFFIPNDDVKTVCEDIAQKYFAGRNYRQNKSEAKHALFVEIYKKNDNGENFCAYTFINNDCIGANDREGQYFAITILCKGFYTYPETVYNMLNQAYNGLYSTKKIIGKTEDGKDKYVIQQFIEQKDLLSNVLKQVDNAFDNITNNCVKVIKKSNTIADYNSWEGNKMCLNVCNSEESYFSLCQIGRIYISNEYPSPSVIVNSLENKIKKLEKDIQEKENNANTEFRSKTSELRKEIEELSKQISERDKVIEKLNDNITEYNNTIDIVKSSLEKYAKVGNKISDVKESKSSYKSKSKIDLLKICILFIILIFTILSAFLNYSFFRNTTSHFEAIEKKTTEVQTKIDSVDSKIIVVNKINDGIQPSKVQYEEYEVISDVLNVRPVPIAEDNRYIIGKLNKGETIKVLKILNLGNDSCWALIMLENADFAFVSGKDKYIIKSKN